MKKNQLKLKTPNGELTFTWEGKSFSLSERKFEERRVQTGLRSAKTVTELGEETLYPSTLEVLSFLAQNKGLLADLQKSEEFAYLAHLYEMVKDEFERLEETTARARVISSDLKAADIEKAGIQDAIVSMLRNAEIPFKPIGQSVLESVSSEKLDWEDVEPGRRHNGVFLGGFQAEWNIDAGQIELYLKEPTINDQSWYLKFIYPKNEYGERFKKTIKAKYLYGFFEYLLHQQTDVDFQEIFVALSNYGRKKDGNFADQNRKHMDEALGKF